MTRGATAYFACCGAVLASSLVYAAPAFATVPVVWYYPLSHAWVLQARPEGFALDWYGRTLWAVLTAVVAFSAGWALTRRMSGASPRAYRLWAVWAGMASLLAIVVYSYQLAHRHPVPEPLPSWYQPR